MKIGVKDRRVIRAFTEHRALDGHKLTTDGTRLDIYGLGGRGVAEWANGKIHFRDLGGIAEQTVHRAIKREAAPYDIARASRRPAGRPRRDPGGKGKFIVKISGGSNRFRGEYSGGATLAEAIVEARTFKSYVGPESTIRVGYFTFDKGDPDDGRFHVSRTIQEGKWS